MSRDRAPTAGGLRGADFSALPKTGLVVIGLSGGADSIALTHCAAQLLDKNRIICAHVNHMLRGAEADRDENFAREAAEKLGLRFELLRENVAEKAANLGIGVEDCGRRVRYDFFSLLAPGESDRILTAHNASDNLETMLLNLARGTGLRGLCGIPRQRGRIIRPLLEVSREDIEAYCAENGLDFVTDSSNLSCDYTRNKLRHMVLPVMREINPEAVTAALGTCGELRETNAFIEKLASTLLCKARRKYGLDALILQNAEKPVLSAALKLFFEENGCEQPERRHIEKAMGILSGGAVTLPGGLTVRVSQGLLTAFRTGAAEGFETVLYEGENELYPGKTLILSKESAAEYRKRKKINNLVFKNIFDCDTITKALSARNRRSGDRFSPAGRKVTKSLKKLFIELKIPPCQRDRLAVIESGGEIIFVEGIGAAERFRVTDETKELMTVEIKEERHV